MWSNPPPDSQHRWGSFLLPGEALGDAQNGGEIHSWLKASKHRLSFARGLATGGLKSIIPMINAHRLFWKFHVLRAEANSIWPVAFVSECRNAITKKCRNKSQNPQGSQDFARG